MQKPQKVTLIKNLKALIIIEVWVLCAFAAFDDNHKIYPIIALCLFVSSFVFVDKERLIKHSLKTTTIERVSEIIIVMIASVYSLAIIASLFYLGIIG